MMLRLPNPLKCNPSLLISKRYFSKPARSKCRNVAFLFLRYFVPRAFFVSSGHSSCQRVSLPRDLFWAVGPFGNGFFGGRGLASSANIIEIEFCLIGVCYIGMIGAAWRCIACLICFSAVDSGTILHTVRPRDTTFHDFPCCSIPFFRQYHNVVRFPYR